MFTWFWKQLSPSTKALVLLSGTGFLLYGLYLISLRHYLADNDNRYRTITIPPVVYDLSILREARYIADPFLLDPVDIVNGRHNLWTVVHVIPWQQSITYNSVPKADGRLFFRETEGTHLIREPNSIGYDLPVHTIDIQYVLSGSTNVKSIIFNWTDKKKRESVPYPFYIQYWREDILKPYITRDGYAIAKITDIKAFGHRGYLIPEDWISHAKDLGESEGVRNTILRFSSENKLSVNDFLAQQNPFIFAYGFNKFTKNGPSLTDSNIQSLLGIRDPRRKGMVAFKLLTTRNANAYRHLLQSVNSESDQEHLRYLLLATLAFQCTNIRNLTPGQDQYTDSEKVKARTDLLVNIIKICFEKNVDREFSDKVKAYFIYMDLERPVPLP